MDMDNDDHITFSEWADNHRNERRNSEQIQSYSLWPIWNTDKPPFFV